MADYKDKMGTVINVGDVIVYGCSSYADIYTGIVTKRNPTLVQVNGTANANPRQSLVVTEQFKKMHPEPYKKLFDAYKDKFQKDVKARDVIRYLIKIVPMNTSTELALIVVVLVNGNPVALDKIKDLVQYSSSKSVARMYTISK